MNATQQCVVRGCKNPPTKVVETDAGLEGGLRIYFCDEHEAAHRAGTLQEYDASRTDPDGADIPES